MSHDSLTTITAQPPIQTFGLNNRHRHSE